MSVRFRKCRIKYILTIFGLITVAILSASIWKPACHPAHNNGNLKSINSDTNIFFIETSGRSTLNARQACAVESAARHHPQHKVHVWMFTSDPIGNSFNLTTALPNIHITSASIKELFEGTPLQEWYSGGEWAISKYRTYHLSDAVRLILVWKFGGIYSDLDVVILRPLHTSQNLLIQESDDSLANSFMRFDANHLFLSHCLNHFQSSYNKSCFGCVGPTLITKCFKSFCNVCNLNDTRTELCKVKVLPSVTSFPVPWQRWKDYFLKERTDEVMNKIRLSMLIHVWNYLSKDYKVLLGSGSAYEEVMKINCPHTYEHIRASNDKYF